MEAAQRHLRQWEASKLSLEAEIELAFTDATFPGNDQLVESESSFEMKATNRVFQNQSDWKKLDADFLDSAPDGMGSALNMLSAEAYRFFLPAYLIADVQGQLKFVEPDFSLCFAFSDAWTGNDRQPFFERHNLFSVDESCAIVAYLRFVLGRCDDPMVHKALGEYWLGKAQLES